MKIYVHHYYSKILFYKLAHNSNNKFIEVDLNTNIGSAYCNYNGVDIEFYFNPEINDNTDGLHLLDFFSALLQRYTDSTYMELNIGDVQDTPIVSKFVELLENKKNWIITLFRTERILTKSDLDTTIHIDELESQIQLLKNHKIISDNLFINDNIRYRFPNIYFAFTNTIWQWNEIIGIRWYYEYKQIFEKLNFDYDLMYSVRNHKKYRCDILKGLAKLNNKKLLLQRTNSAPVSKFYNTYENELSEIDNIHFNSINGTTDFENITLIQYQSGLTWDLWFRMLSKAKIQILDESWAHSKDEFQNQYFSEKTLGLVLANIPFVSTHSYPLEMLQKVLNISEHPFYNEAKLYKGNVDLFVSFIDSFLKNFDENYKKIKEWTNECHIAFVKKIESENTMLDMLLDDFKTENDKINSNKKFL
jgi:hypothetical protein